MQVFYSEAHRKHEPPFEIFDGGLRVPYLENTDRMDRILNALRETNWAEILEPQDFGLDPIYAVHDRDYVEFLASAWTEWLASDARDKSTLLPSTFALRHHTQKPTSLLGRAGYYMMDLSACIVEGTYAAALASAHCALGAAEAVANGEGAAFGLCRPPGHHAGRDYAGGYCFLNNAAVGANWLSESGKVALLDVDYHCGNGTQDIFYDRSDVLTISIHADPDFEYPHFAGYAGETGTGVGAGYHRNFPLEKGTGDRRFLRVLEQALTLIRGFDPAYLVISAGMDIYADDPLGTIQVTTEGIGEIGKRIAALGLPTVIVMEGGYNNEALGRNIVKFITPFTVRRH
ncbi:MAG TPA: histone deacetylase family protein [Anaerolineales bacterium]|nr:histone deacetylase family protein [Anaerolineales bacterium]